MFNVKARRFGWRVMSVEFENGKVKDLDSIVFYNKDGVLFTCPGYIEAVSQNGVQRRGDVECITLSQVRNCRKVDMSKGDNFLKGGTLYINIEGDECQYVKTITTRKNMNNSVYYYDNHFIVINGVEYEVERFSHAEKTKYGETIDNLVEAFRERGLKNVGAYDIEKMYELGMLNIEELLK